MKDESLKEILGYILGSIQFIEEWTKNHNQNTFMKDIKTRDAVTNRLKLIGVFASRLDGALMKKYKYIPWNLFIVLESIDIVDYEDIWFLLKKGIDGEGLLKLSQNLNEIYEHEILGVPFKVVEIDSDRKWTRDYKYPIVTKNSIWTVELK